MLVGLPVLVTVTANNGTLVLEAADVTTGWSGGVPCAVALLVIDCAVTSAAVVVYFPVHVSDAPAPSDGLGTGESGHSGQRVGDADVGHAGVPEVAHEEVEGECLAGAAEVGLRGSLLHRESVGLVYHVEVACARATVGDRHRQGLRRTVRRGADRPASRGPCRGKRRRPRGLLRAAGSPSWRSCPTATGMCGWIGFGCGSPSTCPCPSSPVAFRVPPETSRSVGPVGEALEDVPGDQLYRHQVTVDGAEVTVVLADHARRRRPC